ncbi:MAG: hypothetical protein JNM69_01250 [Archangium sp.]|nr:hypothetical protein [Archangium sp.]
MERRAAQMERHIDRLEGRPVTVPLDGIHDSGFDHFDEEDEAVTHVIDDVPFGAEPLPLKDDGLGFGDELMESPAPRAVPVAEPTDREALFDRGPQAADPAIEAWCSFCCQPKAEVGPLVAGPAGAYICGSCVMLSANLLAMPAQHVPPPPQKIAPVSGAQLPAQAKARAMWDRRQPKVALVVGPEGAGKTAFLESLGRPAARPFARSDDDTVLVDLSSPLSAEEETALEAWLAAHPKRRAVLAARGDAPTPVLVLQGEHGDEPVYDTESLHRSVASHVSPKLLSRVETVLPMPTPDREALVHLAQSLLAARSIELPANALDSIVTLAERSGRGARELAALIARIPAGRYKAP